MSKVSKRNIISASIAGLMALGCSQMVSADPLNDLQKEEDKIRVAAVQSQKKIDSIFEQTQELLVEYRAVVDETENLKVYNDYVATLVKSQEEEIASLQSQIDSIEETKRGVVPLMVRMIDALEEFIELDVPINYEKRVARVESLRNLMERANVTVSEKFRKILEAYKIENEYADGIAAYTGTMNFEGQDITVDVCSRCHPFFTGKQKIVDSGDDISADRLKNAAATKKLAVFDAFEILNRIQDEEDMLNDKPKEEKEEKSKSFKGFAEGRSR